MTSNIKSFWRYPQCDRGVSITPLTPIGYWADGYFGVFDEDAYAYKKVGVMNHQWGAVILLMVPAGAIAYITHHKCRVSEVVPIGYHVIIKHEAFNGILLNNPIEFKTRNKHILRSNHDMEFKYHMGKFTAPKQNYIGQCAEECAAGIHVFRTFQEAENY